MSFDLLAPHYRWMEFVLAGEKLQRCRTAFLDETANPKNILILGEGNGRFLVECRTRFPRAKINCVDASKKMLAQARRRLKSHGFEDDGVEFTHADALLWKPTFLSHDLIVTHFFLDCFCHDQLEQLLKKIAEASTPDVTWLLADFQAPEKGWQKYRARTILKTMYLFFRVATRLPARDLASPDEILRKQGFILRERRVSEWGLLRSDKWVRARN